MLRQTLSTAFQKCVPAYPLVNRSIRGYASATGDRLVELEVNDKTGIALLTLNRKPVNGLNLELLTDISNALDEVKKNKSKGLILTSSSKTVFSAGLDILEMYKPDQDRVVKFWSTLQEVWLKLYGSSFPTAAAINGHAPAGGCLIALCCEYRVMVPNFTIGLNETKLGIIAPLWFRQSMQNVLSTRETEKALTLGTMFTTEEALKNGLIDEIATDKEDAILKCAQFLSLFKAVSPMARSITKQALRKEALDDLQNNLKRDLDTFLLLVNQPQVQKGLEIYLQSLKKK